MLVPFSMKTRSGVYHDIKESPYCFTIGRMKFFFSSRFYLNNFMKRYQLEKDKFNNALNNIYKHCFDLSGDYLAWVRLYTQIEKRGFYIQLDGSDITCLENLHFDVIPTYNKNLDE